MDAAVETKIWLALKSRIATLGMNIPVLMPAEKHIQPTTEYIRVGRVTIDPSRVLIANGKKYERTGFLMLTLVSPLHSNIEVFDNKAGKIAMHFADGKSMQYSDVCVTVTSYPHVVDGYEDGNYWNTPVRIPWRCFA